MTSEELPIDHLLAAVLRGEPADWPLAWHGSDHAARVTERIAYHGVAGLLAAEARRLDDWPPEVLGPLRHQAIALAMWEMRHQVVLGELLAGLAGQKIRALLLKGTALAYDLYPTPATRARGDSDLLVAEEQLAAARAVLERLGYHRQPLDDGIADDLALQEVWSLKCDAGTRHHIDLHWQVLNAPALRGVLDFATCAADPLPLPRLSPDALAMRRVLALLHCCVHRAMHLMSPYFVDGVTYYGGDRLIWAKDIDLLAAALSADEWRQFGALAVSQGVAAVCLDGLGMADRALATPVPKHVLDTLSKAGVEPASTYLLEQSQMGRAWQDFLAIRGLTRKIAYLGARAVPSEEFMRAKYRDLAGRPLLLLRARRMIGLVRRRRGSRAPR